MTDVTRPWRTRLAIPRPRTLTSKLLAAVIGMFIAVALVTGSATGLVMNRVLIGQLDEQLVESLTPLARARGDGPDNPPGAILDSPCARGGPGRGEGTVLVCFAGNLATGYYVSDNSRVPLSIQQVNMVNNAGVSDTAKEVHLTGLGTYRMVAMHNDAGVTLVSGSPTRFVRAAVAKLLAAIGLTSLAGLILVSILGRWLIRRNLLPLTRVAAVANRVSRLKLASGDVALAERVPTQHTDQRTEVGQVGGALNTMLDNVESALQARQDSEMRVRRFVADASHELRTPLASIRGYAELSRREREPVPAQVAHAIGRVESEALRMQGLVEDLLLLARLDAGRPLESDTVDLSLLAMNAVSDAHAAAPDHHFELDLPDEPVEVSGDRARLHQILVNLLGNTQAHTPAGTRVVTRLRREGEEVRLSVNDNGPGIPEGLQPDVFERFTRGDDSRSREAGSTGLGLSIVAAVGQAHGGRVELSSAPGNTTVSVLLPSR